jgi:hypothetical protein
MSGGDIRFVTIPTGTPALDTPVDGIAVQVDTDDVRTFVRDTIAATDTAAAAAAAASTQNSTSSAPAPTTAPDAGISAAGVTCVD